MYHNGPSHLHHGLDQLLAKGILVMDSNQKRVESGTFSVNLQQVV